METRTSSSVSKSRSRPTERLVDDIKDMVQRAEEKAVESAKAADKVVRDRPYQTLGIALGVGILLGMLIRRRRSRVVRAADPTGA